MVEKSTIIPREMKNRLLRMSRRGIVSAAIDGIKTADVLIARYAPPR